VGVTMCVFYISNDSDIDAERCRISLCKKAPITVFGVNLEGAAWFTGIVTSIQFDSSRDLGARWRVVMEQPALRRGKAMLHQLPATADRNPTVPARSDRIHGSKRTRKGSRDR
jgi:hypothetical protein